jgi:hypothetical protein
MFNADLWHLFAPLLAGSGALLSIALLVWLFRKSVDEPFLPWFKDQVDDFLHAPRKRSGSQRSAGAPSSSGSREFFLYPLLACAVFGFGVVLDSAVDDFVDNEPMAAAPLRWLGGFLLPSEAGQRFAAMYYRKKYVPRYRPIWEDEPGPRETRVGPRCPLWRQVQWQSVVPLAYGDKVYRCEDLWKPVYLGCEGLVPSGLGDELLRDRRLYAHFLDSGKPTDLSALSSPDRLLNLSQDPDNPVAWKPELQDRVQWKREWKAHCEVAELLSRKLFYDANNWARRQATYRDELARWTAQVSLVGSIHVASMLAAVALGGMLLASRRWKRQLGMSDTKRRSACGWFWISLVTAWLSVYSYTIAERNYIERALGAYSSAAHNDPKFKIDGGESVLKRLCGLLQRDPMQQPELAYQCASLPERRKVP